jgi:LEA14-like dessication related protein
MKTRYIIIAIVVAVIAFYLRVISAAKNLAFGVGSIRGLKLSGGIISWTQVIKVTNGESVAIPITSANFENRFNNTVIGKSILPRMQTIAARSITDLEIFIAIPVTDLLGLGVEIFNTIKAGSFTFELAGNVRALGVSVPVSQQFNINFKQLF